MALVDPNIALSGKNIELQDPLAQYGKVMAIQGAMNQNQLARYQLSSAQRADQQAAARLNALQSAGGDPTAVANALLKSGDVKGYMDLLKDQREQQKSQVETWQKRQDLINQARRDTSANPSDAQVTAHFEDMINSGLFKPDEIAKFEASKNQLLAMPFEQRKTFLAQQGASAGELKPTVSVAPTGIVQTPAFGGPATVVPGTEAAFQMTPAQIAQNKIAQQQLAVSQGNLAVAQGHLQVAKERLKEEGVKLNPEDDAILAKAIAENRVDVNRVNGRNAKYLIAALKANPEVNLLESSLENISAGAGARAMGVQTAKMQTAAIEADKMIDIVKTTSAAIDRTQFPTINAIQNAVDKGTGGKEIVQLNTAINSLVNSYARAISPTGQPTVSDKNHAREVINSAYSNGQINAITDIMRQEMNIAKGSAVEASAAARATREQQRTGAPALAGQDKQALDWANANPNDPRAARIKERLGVR